MEKLYNGIQLPDQWPPRYDLQKNKDIIPVPYLDTPPDVINIDIGRQLFVDDFLIERTNLEQVYHQAEKYNQNPVMKPETRLELGDNGDTIPCAAPLSGGVWYDQKDHKFRMWYNAGWLMSMAYAESMDGIHWIRPILDEGRTPYGNRLLANFRSDTNCVFPDDASQYKYKAFMRGPGGNFGGYVAESKDGINWTNFTETSWVGDKTTIFYNPFRKKWIYSIRVGWGKPAGAHAEDIQGNIGRAREYVECDCLFDKTSWQSEDRVQWMRTDCLDKQRFSNVAPQLYNVDAVAYESIMLGMFEIHLGPENDICCQTGVPKKTELIPMYSRDGFHFSRPCRAPIISYSDDPCAWDKGYVQSVGGIGVVFDDEIWLYYSAFSGNKHMTSPDLWQGRSGMYWNGATGIAKLRRDGFVSLHAKEQTGELVTRTLTFTHGKYLFVNCNGCVKCEILDENMQVFPEYTMNGSKEIDGDYTCVKMEWKTDIQPLCNQKIKFRFVLSKGDLYSFWISDTDEGVSNGYLPNYCDQKNLFLV